MPIVVVSDSSPIRALHHLGLLSLFRDLYGTVIVPKAVQAELRQPTTTCPALEITNYAWLEIRSASSRIGDFAVPADLDPGESEAIVLAIELRADLVLIDERKATDAARALGLATVGTLGILVEAKRKQLIDRVLPCVDRLVSELRFFVSPTLRQRLAELAGE